MAKGYPNARAIFAAMKAARLHDRKANKPWRGLTLSGISLKFSGLPDDAGVPVRVEWQSAPDTILTFNLISENFADFPDSDFQILPDYKDRDITSASGQGRGR
jgi:hypothetical protein